MINLVSPLAAHLSFSQQCLHLFLTKAPDQLRPIGEQGAVQSSRILEDQGRRLCRGNLLQVGAAVSHSLAARVEELFDGDTTDLSQLLQLFKSRRLL